MMNSRPRAWIAVGGVLAAILALAAACGSTGDDSASVAGRGPNGETIADGSNYSAGPAGNADSADSNREAAPPASVPVGADGKPAGGTLPALLDRKIIRTATLTVETDAVSQRFEDVGTIAAGAGGFVASSSFGNDGDRQVASITIRVPGERYQDVLMQLREIGDVRGEQSSANDVTEEYTDLQSRLRNLQATEQRYLDLLSRATNIDEILTVQDRINATRAEIEQVQGRIQLLGNQTDLATITVHLAPPAVAKQPEEDTEPSGPLEAAEEAFQASLEVLLGAATVVLAVAAFSWWLVPLAAAAIIYARRQARAARERHAPPPAL